MNIGAHMKLRGGFGNVDNAKLQIVGKVEGFDYAAAAQAVQAKIDELLPGGVKGDVNLDGAVTAGDIDAIIDVLTGTSDNSKADVNEDGQVTAGDVDSVIDILITE